MPHIRIHYVRPFDPCGKLIIRAAAEGWAGEKNLPHHTEDEYMRGMCELIGNSVRLLRPDENGLEWDLVMERAHRLIFAAVKHRLGALDPAVALSDFADEYPSRFEDDYVLGDSSAREAFASDALAFAAAPNEREA